ncbi:MAG: hypothetical protein QOJ29_2453 [Thermoleophilaceae bacterium]|nr:hypothetical protein [Thermoleophilaceae bacterium]
MGALAVVVVIGAGVVLTAGSGGRGPGAQSARAVARGGLAGEEVNLDPTAIAKERGKAGKSSSAQSGGTRARVVVAVPPGSASEQERAPRSSSRSRAATDAEIERDLSEFRKYLATIPPASGDRAEVTPQGQAAVPFNAPPIVGTVVSAANEISRTPYRWGGGHGAWRDKGYDCSGSVSFALAAAGLLNGPLTSGAFMKYGEPGPGKWITLYTNQRHIFMVVAGIRYDTSALAQGSRWQPKLRPTNGFVARHPPGL